jgi:MFS transporter, DHA2 family, methylenomycin A resistance protein
VVDDARPSPRNDSNLSRRKALTLTAMSLGFVVVQLDVTVVNVGVKSIGAALGGGVSGLQWVVNAYTISFAALILTAGAAGDRLGAKRVFTAGFAIFVAASLGCAAAPGIGLLIAARAVQGCGAAILVPCSLALLNHTYVDDHERTHAVGVWAAGASVALAAGPVVGGLLIEAIGWRSIFFINIPLGLFGLWLTWRYVAETPRTKSRGLDYAGQVLAILALAGMAAAIIEAGRVGRANRWIASGFVVAFIALIAFVLVEHKGRDPMLPLSVFKDRTFSASTSIGWLVNVAYYGLIFVLSLYFQEIRNYTALKTGLAFLPMTAIVLAANLSASYFSAKIGSRLTMFIGQALFAIGCFALLSVGATGSYRDLAFQLLIIGAGIGLTVPPMTSVLLGTVDKKHSGIASGVLNSARQAGSVVGVALLGSFVAQRSHFVHGFHKGLVVSGFAVTVGTFVSLLVQTNRASNSRAAIGCRVAEH